MSRCTTPGPDPSELSREFEALVVKPGRYCDVETSIASFRHLARRARAQGNQCVSALCETQLAHLHWSVGRPEAALRGLQRLLRAEPSNMHAWLHVVKLHLALGRPRQALALAKRAMDMLDGGRKRHAEQQWRRAELQYEAALSAHLLGDVEGAITWLRLCTQKLPKGHPLASQQEALLLLDPLRIGAGKSGSIRRVELRAHRVLQRARRHPLAAAALAIVAHSQGDANAMAKWAEAADDRARPMIGSPFCHDDWQQTQAILRRTRGFVASVALSPKPYRSGMGRPRGWR